MRTIALAVLLVLPALAQQPAPQQPAFFTETIEVRVVNVDVYVTSRDGKAVTGLTQDDFQIFEDGKPQPITNFLEVHEEPAPNVTASVTAAQRVRNVVVFFDMTSMVPFARGKVFEPLSKVLRETLRPGDRVMVVTWNPGLRIELPLTDDVASADRLLKILSGKTPPVEERIQLPAQGSSVSDALRIAHTYAEKGLYDQSLRVDAIKSVLSSMRGLDGHNVLVLLTDKLARNPATPVFAYFQDSMREYFEANATFNLRDQASRYEQPKLVEEISGAANASRVTIYPISTAGASVEFDRVSAEHNSGESKSSRLPLLRNDQALYTMTEIAARTGGKALIASNNFDFAFRTLAQDLTTYYSLGYRPDNAQKDAARAITVKLKKKGYEVRSRETFIEKSQTSEMQDAVAANLVYPLSKNDLNISLARGADVPSAQPNVVPLVVKIPTGSLTFIPDGTDVVGRFSSYTAFTRRDGKVSEAKRTEHEVRFPADTLKRRKEITLKYDVIVDGNTDSVSVGIMDDTSHATGFAIAQLANFPPAPAAAATPP